MYASKDDATHPRYREACIWVGCGRPWSNAMVTGTKVEPLCVDHVRPWLKVHGLTLDEVLR